MTQLALVEKRSPSNGAPHGLDLAEWSRLQHFPTGLLPTGTGGGRQSANGEMRAKGISNWLTQTDALGRPVWAVWMAERTRGQRPVCPFGSYGAPSADA
jgi:hypothetical protein